MCITEISIEGAGYTKDIKNKKSNRRIKIIKLFCRIGDFVWFAFLLGPAAATMYIC